VFFLLKERYKCAAAAAGGEQHVRQIAADDAENVQR